MCLFSSYVMFVNLTEKACKQLLHYQYHYITSIYYQWHYLWLPCLLWKAEKPVFFKNTIPMRWKSVTVPVKVSITLPHMAEYVNSIIKYNTQYWWHRNGYASIETCSTQRVKQAYILNRCSCFFFRSIPRQQCEVFTVYGIPNMQINFTLRGREIKQE